MPANVISLNTSGTKWIGAASNDRIGCIVAMNGRKIKPKIRMMTRCCCVLFQPFGILLTYTFRGRFSVTSIHSACVIDFAPTNMTCGSNGWISGLLQMIATWVKNILTFERLCSCRGIVLQACFPRLATMLPFPWVNTTGTDVSSKFSNKGSLPSSKHCRWRCCDHCQQTHALRSHMGEWQLTFATSVGGHKSPW